MECNDYELHACRDKVFDRLCEIWDETKKTFSHDEKSAWSRDIWRKANTLQAVSQYWHTCSDAARKQKAMRLMKDGYEIYNTRKTEGWWVDDFGWWGGFFCDLIDYTVPFPETAPFDRANLLTEIKYCYTRMLKNFDEEEGGIWNHMGGGDDREKNTITNTWMLNLASDLVYLDDNTDKNKEEIIEYKNRAAAQYEWLTTGKYKNSAPKCWHLYTSKDSSKALLLWRPGNGSTSGRYWSGDEGVFLRGLSPYIGWIVTDPASKSALLRNAKDLINAAINTETGFPDKESVMHESPKLPAPPGWDTNLVTGKGVFMRLVTRFARAHGFFADKDFEGTFKGFVKATAESAWCSREIPKDGDKTKWVISPNWNPEMGPREENQPVKDDILPQVLQTAGLDALNAAVQIA